MFDWVALVLIVLVVLCRSFSAFVLARIVAGVAFARARVIGAQRSVRLPALPAPLPAPASCPGPGSCRCRFRSARSTCRCPDFFRTGCCCAFERPCRPAASLPRCASSSLRAAAWNFPARRRPARILSASAVSSGLVDVLAISWAIARSLAASLFSGVGARTNPNVASTIDSATTPAKIEERLSGSPASSLNSRRTSRPPNNAIARRHRTGNSGVRRARTALRRRRIGQRGERHDLLVAIQQVVELGGRRNKVVGAPIRAKCHDQSCRQHHECPRRSMRG